MHHRKSFLPKPHKLPLSTLDLPLLLLLASQLSVELLLRVSLLLGRRFGFLLALLLLCLASRTH